MHMHAEGRKNHKNQFSDSLFFSIGQNEYGYDICAGEHARTGNDSMRNEKCEREIGDGGKTHKIQTNGYNKM